MIPFTKDELSDMVWLATGKAPSHVRTQALLVVGEFPDGTTSVHHIDLLVVKSAMSHRWPVRSYLDAEDRLS